MAFHTIGLVSRTYRHISRYRRILSVLIKYGFGELVDRLKIAQYVEVGLRTLSGRHPERLETLSLAQRVRMALQELGPTFIKLGQVLSTRPDLVPHEFITELARLRQEVPPFPFEQVREIIQTELDRPLEAVYEHFDPRSIAAASIGQVHRARLRDGQEVVVKVQRPNIEKVIEVDLDILLHLATLVEKHIPEWKLHRPTRIVEEFRRVLERELDFGIEARHLERFASQFRDDDTIYIPKVFRQASSRRVLTLEYVPVIPVADPESLRAAGLDPKEIARRGAELTLKQVFVNGFFHADPHPGNVFVLPGNVICLLDFGMMGRLDRRGREDFADLAYSITAGDPAHAANALLRLTTHEEDLEPDLRRLEADLAEFIDLHIPAVVGELNFGTLLRGLLDLVRRHRLTIPPELVMMMKAAATAERLVAQLDPDLNLIQAARPYVLRLRLDRFRPDRLLRQTVETGGELLHLAREIPGGLRDLLRQAKRGGLKINFEHRGLERLLEAHERASNRLSLAVVTASLIIGSSLMVHWHTPPVWHQFSVSGLIGFLAAGGLGLLLLVSIVRHGRL